MDGRSGLSLTRSASFSVPWTKYFRALSADFPRRLDRSIIRSSQVSFHALAIACIHPRFAPTHVGNDAGFISVSEIFVLKRLGKSIGTPVPEWDMLKTTPGTIWRTLAVGGHTPLCSTTK